MTSASSPASTCPCWPPPSKCPPPRCSGRSSPASCCCLPIDYSKEPSLCLPSSLSLRWPSWTSSPCPQKDIASSSTSPLGILVSFTTLTSKSPASIDAWGWMSTQIISFLCLSDKQRIYYCTQTASSDTVRFPSSCESTKTPRTRWIRSPDGKCTLAPRGDAWSRFSSLSSSTLLSGDWGFISFWEWTLWNALLISGPLEGCSTN